MDSATDGPEIKMAIAKFATAKDIADLFVHVNEDGEEMGKLMPLPKPNLYLIMDNQNQLQIENGAITENTAKDFSGLSNYLLYVYEDNISKYPAPETTEEERQAYWETIRQFIYVDQVTDSDTPLVIEAPVFTESSASRFQSICIQALGDDFNSINSEVETPITPDITRLKLAAPIISSPIINGDGESETHTYTITKPDTQGFSDTVINYNLITQTFDYDKATNIIKSTTIEPNEMELTLGLGEEFQCSTTGTTSSSRIQIIDSLPTVKRSLYRALAMKPTLTSNGIDCTVIIDPSEYRSATANNPGVPFEYTQIVEENGVIASSEQIALPITFICSVKPHGVNIFDPAFEVTAELKPIINADGDTVGYQDIPIIIKLKDGDTLQVQPKIEKYISDSITTITVEKVSPEEAGIIDLNNPAVVVDYYELAPGWSKIQ